MDKQGRSKLPVFVFPTSLNFYLASRQSHKQLLTIYNPYEFAVRFKVLCTSPNKYTVIDPEGAIGPQCCVDIVVRHTMPIVANCNVTDRFRLTMLDHTTKQVLGRRDITARLHQGEPDTISNDSAESFQPLLTLPTDKKTETPRNVPYMVQNVQRPHQPNYIAIIIGLVSLLSLFLPTCCEPPGETLLPSYLSISVNLKIVAAFMLGLVFMVVLRP